jgi:hypothetical protein
MDSQITKALVEIRKSYAEIMIVVLDHKAHMMALEETLFRLDSQARGIFDEQVQVERNKIREERDKFQSIVETLKTIIEKFPTPTGTVH